MNNFSSFSAVANTTAATATRWGAGGWDAHLYSKMSVNEKVERNDINRKSSFSNTKVRIKSD